MEANVLVWDLETIPDLRGFAAANELNGKSDAEIREAMGDKFPKHIYHSNACIGALIAHRNNDHWVVDALGAPHIEERSEKDLITSFVDRISELKPQQAYANSGAGPSLIDTVAAAETLDFFRSAALPRFLCRRNWP